MNIRSRGGTLLDLSDGSVRRAFPHPAEVVAFSPDGDTLAIGARDGTISLFDPESGEVRRTLEDGHGYWVRSLAFNADGTRLVSVQGAPGIVILWDLSSGKALNRSSRYESPQVAFSPDGGVLLIAGGSAPMAAWRLSSGEDLELPRNRPSETVAVAISPDGQRIASVGHDGPVTLRSWPELQEIGAFRGHPVMEWVGDGRHRLVFSSDGRRLAAISRFGRVTVWDTASREIAEVLGGYTREVENLVFSPTDDRVAMAGGDRTIVIWDWSRDDAVQTFEGRDLARAALGEPTASLLDSEDADVAVSRNGNKVARITGIHRIELSDATVQEDAVYRNYGRRIVFSPRGRYVAAVFGTDGVAVWDASTVERLRTFLGYATCVSISHDDELLAIGWLNGEVAVHDLVVVGKMLISSGS